MSSGGPPVALVGFHNGHFLRADVSVTGLDTVKLTHHRSSVNHLASLTEVSGRVIRLELLLPFVNAALVI